MSLSLLSTAALPFCLAVGLPLSALAATHLGNPANYHRLLRPLEPGDSLELAAGRYARGLRVHELNSFPGRPSVIEGPAGGERAVLVGRKGHNTINIKNTSYVFICNLEIDDLGAFVDGVKAEGDSAYAHDITVENLDIHDLAKEQR